MSDSTIPGNGGLPKVVATHSSGSLVELYLFGATLTSFKAPSGQELLFTSSKAVFDGKKAIRGGVPLVFPQFGANGPLPQHGFARNQVWSLKHAGEGLVELELSDNEATRALWPHAFHLLYRVQFDEKRLVTSLHITNPKHHVGSEAGAATEPSSSSTSTPFSFDALLHTYFSIGEGNIEGIAVHGLGGGKDYISKPEGGAKKKQEEEPLAIKGGIEVDRVYYNCQPTHTHAEGASFDAAPPHSVVLSGIKGPTSSVAITTQTTLRDAGPRGGTIHGFPSDVVVWNPGPARAATIADLGADDWKSYVCIEPGRVSEESRAHPANHHLPPGKTWTLQQTLTLL